MGLLLVATEPPAEQVAATRFRGRPLLTADTAWPTCKTCAGNMGFLGQLVVPTDRPAQPLLVSLFMCENDPGMCNEWDAGGGGNAALTVDSAVASVRDLPPEGVVGHPGSWGVVPFGAASDDPSDDLAGAVRSARGAAREPVMWLASAPQWIQDDETPRCRLCGERMTFLAQLFAGPDQRAAFNFGDGGEGYVFSCACTTGGSRPGRAAFLWQS